MKTYKTLHSFGTDEYIVEKSTFIGYAKPKRNTHQKNLCALLIAYAHYTISFTFRI